MSGFATIVHKKFVITFLAQITVSFVYCLLVPTLPLYFSRRGYSEMEIGVLIGSLGLSSLMLRPFVGRFLQKTSEVRFMMVGTFLFTLTSILLIWEPPLGFLLGVRVFQGVACAFFYTAAVTFVAHHSPEGRLGQSISYYYLGFHIALVLAPSLGISIINALDFRWLFAFCALLSFLSLLLTLVLRKTPFDPASEGQRGEDAFLSRQAIPAAIVVFFASMTYGGIGAFFPLFAIEKGMSNPGHFFSTFAATVIVGRSIGSRMLDLYSRRAVIGPCLGAYVAALGLLFFFENPTMFLVSAAIWGLGHALLFPALIAHTLETTAPLRGPAMGTILAFDDLGIGLGPVVMGLLLPWTGFHKMFLLLALLGIFNLVYFRFLVRKKIL